MQAGNIAEKQQRIRPGIALTSDENDVNQPVMELLAIRWLNHSCRGVVFEENIQAANCAQDRDPP